MGLMDREWYHKASEHNVKRFLDEAESRNKKQTVKLSCFHSILF